jgi:hypothetical protein|mmetsp:Transcript_72735/g.113816  ORF Transcript_72735/g.113816 Transcript_72735/m.113816 type:complete len:120 (-) Transcript_72735:1115-1474(-)
MPRSGERKLDGSLSCAKAQVGRTTPESQKKTISHETKPHRKLFKVFGLADEFQKAARAISNKVEYFKHHTNYGSRRKWPYRSTHACEKTIEPRQITFTPTALTHGLHIKLQTFLARLGP